MNKDYVCVMLIKSDADNSLWHTDPSVTAHCVSVAHIQTCDTMLLQMPWHWNWGQRSVEVTRNGRPTVEWSTCGSTQTETLLQFLWQRLWYNCKFMQEHHSFKWRPNEEIPKSYNSTLCVRKVEILGYHNSMLISGVKHAYALSSKSDHKLTLFSRILSYRLSYRPTRRNWPTGTQLWMPWSEKISICLKNNTKMSLANWGFYFAHILFPLVRSQ